MRKLIIIQIIILSVYILAQSGVKDGDKAPSISVEDWLKGEPVAFFEKGKVYLIEFWATWCTPCTENIPHLSDLQKKYESEGMTVIGIATHEFDGREKLDKFMEKRGQDMEYRIAYDSDFSMERDWDTGVIGSNNFRLPVCFLVNKEGIISFAGHPADKNLENLINKALKE